MSQDTTDADDVEQIVYQHTTRPHYQTPDGELTDEWGGPADLDHAVDRRDYGELSPVVFDIETNAETPQRPIIVTIYDEQAAELDVAYLEGYQGQSFDKEDIEARARANMGDLAVDKVRVHRNISQSWFETWCLRRVAGNEDKCLVGHNIPFDLGIMASPNYGAIEAYGQEGKQWDAAMTYSDMTCFSKRAGAFGRLYSWMDQQNQGRITVVDTQTAAKSLWLPASLSDLAEHYGIGGIDVENGEHGELTADYVAYNVDDVRQTTEAFHALTESLQSGFSTDMTLDGVYSTASIAKDVLARMGYERTHYTQEAASVIPPAYFGGNTEALGTGRLIEDVTYQDILSQYPTVAGLTGVWGCMRAEKIDVTEVDHDELPELDYADLQTADAWEQAASYYVKIEASGATLPVRTKMAGTDTTRVYNADVSHKAGEGTIHHYMDVLAARLHGGADVDIQAVWRVDAEGEQTLKSAQVGGTKIEADDNVMTRSIEERKALQQQFGGKNERTKSLKITANACYGISAERIVEESGETGEDGYERFDIAGKFYNPHVACCITAGGRLMLALGEAAADRAGGSLHYCDTDSLIVDADVADATTDVFANLNPYRKAPVCDADVLEIEDGHDADGNDVELAGVDLFALGVKKYAVLKDKELVKYTEHGLGHFSTLRSDDEVRKFWITLMRQFYDMDVNGQQYGQDEVTEPLVWQQGASTEHVRALIDKHLTGELRYGDWVQRVIDHSNDGTQRIYLGIDVTEQAVKVTVQPDGTITGPNVLEADELEEEDLKTTFNLMNDWWHNQQVRAARYGRRPTCRVIGSEVVTKEATSIEMALEETIESAIRKVAMRLIT